MAANRSLSDPKDSKPELEDSKPELKDSKNEHVQKLIREGFFHRTHTRENPTILWKEGVRARLELGRGITLNGKTIAEDGIALLDVFNREFPEQKTKDSNKVAHHIQQNILTLLPVVCSPFFKGQPGKFRFEINDARLKKMNIQKAADGDVFFEVEFSHIPILDNSDPESKEVLGYTAKPFKFSFKLDSTGDIGQGFKFVSFDGTSKLFDDLLMGDIDPETDFTSFYSKYSDNILLQAQSQPSYTDTLVKYWESIPQFTEKELKILSTTKGQEQAKALLSLTDEELSLTDEELENPFISREEIAEIRHFRNKLKLISNMNDPRIASQIRVQIIKSNKDRQAGEMSRITNGFPEHIQDAKADDRILRKAFEIIQQQQKQFPLSKSDETVAEKTITEAIALAHRKLASPDEKTKEQSSLSILFKAHAEDDFDMREKGIEWFNQNPLLEKDRLELLYIIASSALKNYCLSDGAVDPRIDKIFQFSDVPGTTSKKLSYLLVVDFAVNRMPSSLIHAGGVYGQILNRFITNSAQMEGLIVTCFSLFHSMAMLEKTLEQNVNRENPFYLAGLELHTQAYQLALALLSKPESSDIELFQKIISNAALLIQNPNNVTAQNILSQAIQEASPDVRALVPSAQVISCLAPLPKETLEQRGSIVSVLQELRIKLIRRRERFGENDSLYISGQMLYHQGYESIAQLLNRSTNITPELISFNNILSSVNKLIENPAADNIQTICGKLESAIAVAPASLAIVREQASVVKSLVTLERVLLSERYGLEAKRVAKEVIPDAKREAKEKEVKGDDIPKSVNSLYLLGRLASRSAGRVVLELSSKEKESFENVLTQTTQLIGSPPIGGDAKSDTVKRSQLYTYVDSAPARLSELGKIARLTGIVHANWQKFGTDHYSPFIKSLEQLEINLANRRKEYGEEDALYVAGRAFYQNGIQTVIDVKNLEVFPTFQGIVDNLALLIKDPHNEAVSHALHAAITGSKRSHTLDMLGERALIVRSLAELKREVDARGKFSGPQDLLYSSGSLAYKQGGKLARELIKQEKPNLKEYESFNTLCLNEAAVIRTPTDSTVRRNLENELVRASSMNKSPLWAKILGVGIAIVGVAALLTGLGVTAALCGGDLGAAAFLGSKVMAYCAVTAAALWSSGMGYKYRNKGDFTKQLELGIFGKPKSGTMGETLSTTLHHAKEPEVKQGIK